jgi:hypothetical protein
LNAKNTKDAGTQSIYRENETQTMPYFPEIKRNKNTKAPEYIQMNDLFLNENSNSNIDGIHVPSPKVNKVSNQKIN